MKKLEKRLTETLNGLNELFSEGQLKKIGKRYLIRKNNGVYTSADTLREVVNILKEK